MDSDENMPFRRVWQEGLLIEISWYINNEGALGWLC